MQVIRVIAIILLCTSAQIIGLSQSTSSSIVASTNIEGVDTKSEGSIVPGSSSTASANISVTIVTPISISMNQEMRFGNLYVSESLGGSIILTPTGTRLATKGVKLPVNSGSITAADFTIMGNVGLAFGIQLPKSILLRHSDGIETMTAAAFTSTPTREGTLGNGSEHIQIGATLRVGAGQLRGLYSSDQFEVVVNYN